MRVVLMAIVLILSSVAANAGRNTPHDPGKFTEYTSVLHFVLTADFMYTERRGIGIKIEQGLRAGTYEAKYQDEDGYYFVGPGLAVCQANPKCSGFNSDGGIWVSRKSKEDIRMFIVQGRVESRTDDTYRQNSTIENEKRAGAAPGAAGSMLGWAIVDMLAARDAGKIFIFPLNKEFASRMISASQSAD